MIVKKRKGISTFIATLLLMVLAVSAGVVIYAYVMGYLGGFGGPQALGSISVESWTLHPENEEMALVVYIRNIGKATFQLDKVYVNGVPATEATLESEGHGKIDENVVGEIVLNNPLISGPGVTPEIRRFMPSTTYNIKIIGVDNTQVSFQVKK